VATLNVQHGVWSSASGQFLDGAGRETNVVNTWLLHQILAFGQGRDLLYPHSHAAGIPSLQTANIEKETLGQLQYHDYAINNENKT
jgi:hypothetical protein